MDLKINQNTSSNYAEEAGAASEVIEFGESFADLAEAQLFEELANAEGNEGNEGSEGGDGAESSGSGGSDSGGSHSGGSGHSGQGSSQGQQRVLDYWSAQKEANDAAEGVSALEGRVGRPGDETSDASGIPPLVLTAEEEAELARAAESFDALAFLDDDEESADWYDDDDTQSLTSQSAEESRAELLESVEMDLGSAIEDLIEGDNAGEIAMGVVNNAARDGDGQQQRSRGRIELTPELMDAVSNETQLVDVKDEDKASGEDRVVPDTSQLKAEAREALETDAENFTRMAADAELEEAQGVARESRLSASAESVEESASMVDEVADAVAAEEAFDQSVEGGDLTSEVAVADGNTLAMSGGDAGQGRSRGQYVMVDEDGLPVQQLQQAKKAGEAVQSQSQGSAQQSMGLTYEQAVREHLAADLANRMALSEDSLRAMQLDEMLAHYLMQREESRLEQQRQEMLDMLQQFQNRLNGLTQLAGQQGFMGAFMMMGFGAGGFMLSPTVDRRGLLVEKAKENLKGAGGKGDSKKLRDPGVANPDVTEQLEEELVLKMASAEDELSLSHDDLMAARKEAFRERFGQWLAAREEELGDQDDQMFIAQMLQSYDQFTLAEHQQLAYVSPLWISAMEMIMPQDILNHCESVLGETLASLRGQLARYVQKTPVLSQNPQGDIAFDPAFAAEITEVSERMIAANAMHHGASSQTDAFAIVAQQLRLPVVAVAFNGDGYQLLTPNLAGGQQLWCPLQVWDIDWARQRHLILIEGERFRLLRRQF